MEEKNAGFGRPSPEEEKLPFFIPRVGYDYKHIIVERPKGFPTYQWLQNRAGTGTLEIDGNVYDIKENTGFFLPKNVVHKYYSKSDVWLLDWIEFSGVDFENIKSNLGIPEFGVYYGINSDAIHHKIVELVNLYRKRPSQKILRGSALGYEILVNITLEIQNQSRQKSRLTPVIDYINNNFEKILSLQDMADIINVTPNHLCALFKSEMKMRPVEYINNIRINNAKHMLKEENNLKICEIAKKCGFENDNYFREVFHRECGLSPREYRLQKV